MADQIPVQKTYSVQSLVGALVLGLVIGVLISSLWSKTGKNRVESEEAGTTTEEITTDGDEQTETSLPSVSEVGPVDSSSNMLVINNQEAGLSVTVSSANVTDANWVVIHEDRNGVPGNALGAARFVGETTSGTIELLRGTLPGQKYQGIIYKDDGDKIFSMERDTPVRDASGNPVGVTFKTN